jgi:hypothetical protein
MPASMEAALKTASRVTPVESTAGKSPSYGATTVEPVDRTPIELASRDARPIEPSSIESWPVEPMRSVEAMKPRAHADEHPSSKPVRTIVSVRRTSVRVVPIVAVRADGRGAHVPVPRPDHSLRVRVRSAKHANPQQSRKSQVTHLGTSFRDPRLPFQTHSFAPRRSLLRPRVAIH